MAIQFLFLSFLAFLLNNGASASSYISSQDLKSNSIAKAAPYNTTRYHHNYRERIVFNVDDYGAKANGTDDHEAFKRAWKGACNSTSDDSVLLVPHKKTYLLNPLIFHGPCEAKSITVMIKGKLKAPSERSYWLIEEDVDYWIKFRNVRHLTVKGGGKLDGSGQVWWQNSCKINESLPCVHGPTALFFYQCKQLRVSDLTLKDSQQVHVVFSYCSDVEASHLTIKAPHWSPNTDGIHLTSTRDMRISNCFIGTGKKLNPIEVSKREVLNTKTGKHKIQAPPLYGMNIYVIPKIMYGSDDCISIVNGSKNVFVKNIVCGPGHGISIGSLGANNSRVHVSNVVVEQATLIGTTNGVRIKTWQGGHGSAKNILFQDISMCNVSNPIIINQNYCDSKIPCHEQNSAVAVKGVLYKNIRGTSASDISINFNCSSTAPCRNIQLQDISLVTANTFDSSSSCINVHSDESRSVFPSCKRRRY